MKVIVRILLCGVFAAVAAAPAAGDEVDDLLAGKPLKQDASDGAFDSSLLEQRIVAPVDSTGIVDGPAWDATIDAVPEPTPSPQARRPARERPSTPASDVSLVPEPSAIALGVAAILYFLIFFRRRHL